MAWLAGDLCLPLSQALLPACSGQGLRVHGCESEATVVDREATSSAEILLTQQGPLGRKEGLLSRPGSLGVAGGQDASCQEVRRPQLWRAAVGALENFTSLGRVQLPRLRVFTE